MGRRSWNVLQKGVKIAQTLRWHCLSFFQVISAWHMQQSSCIWQRKGKSSLNWWTIALLPLPSDQSFGDDCLKTMCERWIVSLVIPSKCKPGCQSHQNCCSGMGQINDWIQPTVTVDGLELQDSYCCCLWLGLAVRSLPLNKLWLIESGLSLPYAFRYKKPGFLPWTPLRPQ